MWGRRHKLLRFAGTWCERKRGADGSLAKARHDQVREAGGVAYALFSHPAVGSGEKLLAAASSDHFAQPPSPSLRQQDGTGGLCGRDRAIECLNLEVPEKCMGRF
jgi:hypothetical protein